MNRLHPKTNLTISTQPFVIFSSSTDTRNDRRNDGNYSSNNSSDQHDRGLSSENNIRFSRHSINVEYVDFENENSPAETENLHNQPNYKTIDNFSYQKSTSFIILQSNRCQKKKEKEHATKKPIKTDRQKKAEAEIMKKLIIQYNGVLSPDELKAMKEVFDTYDTKNQEFIKTSLLGKILRTLGFNPLESDIQRITKEIDPENTDQLKFPEYIIAFLSTPKAVTDQDIIPAFQVFDPDKRGLIEAEEMLKHLSNIGEQLNEIEAKTFKDNMHINEEGLFDYNEFYLKFTQPPKPKKKKKGKKKKKKNK